MHSLVTGSPIFPTGHGTQVAFSGSGKEPGAQGMQSRRPRKGWTWLRGQLAQSEAPSEGWIEPGAQSVHEAAADWGEEEPRGQGMQAGESRVGA